ncbi:MAG TPA: hypothetical protein VMV59_01955 [Candidatus Dormibacteraeota bacterium]|nr:hypothetical protein [Candidatus Dormibacteraeota bacterium]
MTTSTDIKLETLISEIETFQAEAETNLRDADELLFRSIEKELPAAHIKKIMQKQREAHEQLTWAQNALSSLRGIRTWDPFQVQ